MKVGIEAVNVYADDELLTSEVSFLNQRDLLLVHIIEDFANASLHNGKDFAGRDHDIQA